MQLYQDNQAHTFTVDGGLITVGLGFFPAVPCIIETTPITMCLFFFFGIPLFGLGFCSTLIPFSKICERMESCEHGRTSHLNI
jgi:hypothetical protein